MTDDSTPAEARAVGITVSTPDHRHTRVGRRSPAANNSPAP